MYVLTIYDVHMHIWVINSGRYDDPYVRKSSLDHNSVCAFGVRRLEDATTCTQLQDVTTCKQLQDVTSKRQVDTRNDKYPLNGLLQKVTETGVLTQTLRDSGTVRRGLPIV